MRIKAFIFVLYFIAVDFCFAQSTISITSETTPFVLHINSTTVNPMANTVAIGPINIGKNHVQLSFTKKGMPELNAQIECPSDGYYHQLSYRVVIASKGPNSLALVSDYKFAVTQTVENNSEPQDEKSNQSNQGQPGQIVINVNTMGMSGNNAPNGNQTTTPPTQPVAQNTSKVPQVQAGLMCANATVTQQTFMQLKYRVSTGGWDMYKAKDSKEFINKNCMLASQVADLVKLVQAEAWQLDIAQFGYMYTFDQANYNVVVDALSTDVSKKKLLDFIGSNAPSPASNNTPPPSYTETVTTSTYSSNTVNNSNPSKTSTGCTPMDEDDFQEVLEATDEPIGEAEKMQVGKSVFDDVCLSTNQVLKVVDLFIDENKKLEFAKFAFSRTSDKDKYFRINKAFISDQRVAELSNFVKQNK
jgi:hypothetical protein